MARKRFYGPSMAPRSARSRGRPRREAGPWKRHSCQRLSPVSGVWPSSIAATRGRSLPKVIQRRRVGFGEGHEPRELKPAAVPGDEDTLEGPGRAVVAQHVAGAWGGDKSDFTVRRTKRSDSVGDIEVALAVVGAVRPKEQAASLRSSS